ncbi:MAG: AMP-binding protein, partial [Proteobacteria bacterium]|nr:AMP-binding protein [Pseudomonadota bacterium]
KGRGPDYWRMARALYAAGFRAGDLVHNCFSYHFTPAGAMLESAAHALGCPVFPGGVGNTEGQVQAIADLGPAGYTGTPSFLGILLDKGRALDRDLSSLAKALVSGEALPPSLRAEIGGFGVAVLQCYATAEAGLIAYESPAIEGMIVDEGVILEIVTPGTGDRVAEGEAGEVVVTVLAPEFPLIRFATGDLSAVLPGASPCGRTNVRIKGWMGRADQATKVKGMFVHPEQVAAVIARHPEVLKGRLVVGQDEGVDVMTLHCEVAAPDEGLAAAVAETLHSVCKLKGRAVLVEPGSLASDGKVIDDVRKLV